MLENRETIFGEKPHPYKRGSSYFVDERNYLKIIWLIKFFKSFTNIFDKDTS